MHTKSSQKFYSREGHKFLIGIVGIIFIRKSKVFIIHVFNACIAQDRTQFAGNCLILSDMFIICLTFAPSLGSVPINIGNQSQHPILLKFINPKLLLLLVRSSRHTSIFNYKIETCAFLIALT